MTNLAQEIEIQNAKPYGADLDEGPQPLMRTPTPATEFPADALGSILQPGAKAIHDMTQAPLAICAQSVLGVASLVAQAHIDTS